MGLAASIVTRSADSVANALVRSTWKCASLSSHVDTGTGSTFSWATGDMHNFFKSMIFFREISCGVRPSTELGDTELLLPKLNFGMTKRVCSASLRFRGILILSEIGEVTVTGGGAIVLANAVKLLIGLSTVVVHGSMATVSIESFSGTAGPTGDLPPKIFGKLNFFFWMPFSVARCFNKSVNELGLESYLT